MSPIAAKRTARSASGFTLVEVMISMALSLIVVGAMLSAFVFLGRSVTRLANQQQVDASTRRAFYAFSKDVAGATTVTPSSSKPTKVVTLSGIPVSNPGDSPVVTKTVTYTYDDTVSSPTLTQSVVTITDGVSSAAVVSTLLGGKSGLEATTISSFSFYYYTASGSTASASQPLSIKRVEFAITTERGSLNSTKASYAAVSPRTAVRNKALL